MEEVEVFEFGGEPDEDRGYRVLESWFICVGAAGDALAIRCGELRGED